MNLSRGASLSTAVAARADTQPEEDVCVALCTLAGVEADNKAKVALAGGYEMVVVQMMAKHLQDVRVQQQGCVALHDLAADEVGRLRLHGLGGIESALAAMGAHPQASAVQSWALAALWNLSWTTDSQTRIAEEGGIEHVATAMKNHPASEAVQENACWAIINIAWHDDNKYALEGLGVIELVLKAMAAYPVSSGVQESACGALSVLAEEARLVKRIKSLSGVERCQHALSAATTENTKRWSLSLLSKLGDPDAKRAVLAKLNTAIKHVVTLVCNDELTRHQLRQTATESVKTHLKNVSTRAQHRLFATITGLKSAEAIDDASIDNLKAGLARITNELAYKVVVQSSKKLVPAFRWLGEPEILRQTKAQMLASIASENLAQLPADHCLRSR